MEHLCCKNFDHLLDDFDRDAISWNAYTDTNLINFYFTGLESKLSKYREKIIELMSSFNVTKEQFEIERNIVLSEYEDVFNDQSQSHYLNLYRKLFNDYDPIGLREDLEKLTFIDCLNFYEKQYMNPSKVINASNHVGISRITLLTNM
jgi:predicted Zn-dependent peptidase